MYATQAHKEESHAKAQAIAAAHSPLVKGAFLSGIKPLDSTALGDVVYILDHDAHAVLAYQADDFSPKGRLDLAPHLKTGIDGRLGVLPDGLLWASMVDGGMITFTPELEVVASRQNAYCHLTADTLSLDGHRHPFSFTDDKGTPVEVAFPSPVVSGDWLARSDGDLFAYSSSKTLFTLDENGAATNMTYCHGAALGIPCVAQAPTGAFFVVVQNEDRSNSLVLYDEALTPRRTYFLDNPRYITGISCIDGEENLTLVLSSYYNSCMQSFHLHKRILELS